MTATPRPPRARGQLVVVGAIVLSMLLVGVAVQLNGVLFVEHESQAEHRTTAPVQVAADATTAVSGAMATVNAANGTSYPGVASNVTALVARWERAAAVRHASDGSDVSVAVRDVTVASRVTDGNDGSPLTSADDLDDWTLASNVTELGESRLRLSGDDLTTQGDPGPFRLVVDNGSATWTLTVTNESSSDDIVVTVASPGDSTTTCTTATRPTGIDLAAGTVAGQPCSHLAVAAEVEPPYTVRYENGSNATGTYALTLVNRTAMPTGRYAADGWPRTRPHVTRTTVGIRYRDTDVEYETMRRVELEA